MQKPKSIWVGNSEELQAELSRRPSGEVIDIKKKLRTKSSADIDRIVSEIGPKIEAAIDCTACGACCKVLEPQLCPEDSKRLANLESKTEEEFLKTRTTRLENGKRFLHSNPCQYLCGNACSIYAQRPESCADFPHLYRPHFLFRRLTWEHYTLCPIVFNVVESLLLNIQSTENEAQSYL